MAVFEVERVSSRSAAEVWTRLTDWERHGDCIPFTSVSATMGGAGTVSEVVARTSIGPLHFDDPMDVSYWRPPTGTTSGLCRLVKRGRVVTGWAVLSVTPTTTGCSVRWTEDAALWFIGPLLAWPTKVIAARVFGRLVDNLLAA